MGSPRSVVESGLGEPFPTPFNAEVTIPFVLAEAGPVRLTLYNLMGQQVRVLADELGGLPARTVCVGTVVRIWARRRLQESIGPCCKPAVLSKRLNWR